MLDIKIEQIIMYIIFNFYILRFLDLYIILIKWRLIFLIKKLGGKIIKVQINNFSKQLFYLILKTSKISVARIRYKVKFRNN